VALTWPITGEDVCTALTWATSRAAEVEDQAEAAVKRVEKEVGEWHGQTLTYTRQLRRQQRAVVLRCPVASVDTVTLDGTDITSSTDTDADAGIVYGPFGPGKIVVTSTARPADTVPEDVILAARYLGAFWAKQEKIGNPSRSSRGTEPDTDVQQGFAMPRRVSEMLRPHLLLGAGS
jgi:hypothetical protein